jgi:hypothetical protein
MLGITVTSPRSIHPRALCQVDCSCEVRHFILPKASLHEPGLFYSIARTALALPSILTRIDEALLVKEANARMFDNVIREDLLRAALTPPGAEVESNYERLEILGNIASTFLPFQMT